MTGRQVTNGRVTGRADGRMSVVGWVLRGCSSPRPVDGVASKVHALFDERGSGHAGVAATDDGSAPAHPDGNSPVPRPTVAEGGVCR